MKPTIKLQTSRCMKRGDKLHGLEEPPRRVSCAISRAWTNLTFVGCLAFFAGCATQTPLDHGLTGPFHHPGNYYLTDRKLPEGLGRIAMLPLTSAEDDLAARSGRESLQTILYGELIKARLFEVALVPSEKLEQLTGKPAWSSDNQLPADFLVRIREATACDAILFSRLSNFRPYPPLAIGWHLMLVNAEDGRIIWKLDEVFDAGEPRVWNSARRYAVENERTQAEFTRLAGTKHGAAFPSRVTGLEWINSPRHFAKYAASAAIETLVTSK
ncbi:MAG: hypothetical protein HYY23_18675 [Verrucomicrobia bacterium]|nr:hypothetical protein [Verrucomicrobiota bacterium]